MDVFATAVFYITEESVDNFLKKIKSYSESHNALIKFYETMPSVSKFNDSMSLVRSIA